MTDQLPPQPTPLTGRPGLWLALLVVGWLVVLGLTVFGLTRYGVSSVSVSPAALDGESERYLRTIRDRLAQW